MVLSGPAEAWGIPDHCTLPIVLSSITALRGGVPIPVHLPVYFSSNLQEDWRFFHFFVLFCLAFGHVAWYMAS